MLHVLRTAEAMTMLLHQPKPQKKCHNSQSFIATALFHLWSNFSQLVSQTYTEMNELMKCMKCFVKYKHTAVRTLAHLPWGWGRDVSSSDVTYIEII